MGENHVRVKQAGRTTWNITQDYSAMFLEYKMRECSVRLQRQNITEKDRLLLYKMEKPCYLK